MLSNIQYLVDVLNLKCEKRHLESGNINKGYKGRKIPWTITHVTNNRQFCYADANIGDTHLCNTCKTILDNRELVYVDRYYKIKNKNHMS